MSSIRVSMRTKRRLAALKEHPRETYAEVLERVLDDVEERDMELSAETKRHIRQARKDLRAGRGYTTEQVRRELGLPP